MVPRLQPDTAPRSVDLLGAVSTWWVLFLRRLPFGSAGELHVGNEDRTLGPIHDHGLRLGAGDDVEGVGVGCVGVAGLGGVGPVSCSAATPVGPDEGGQLTPRAQSALWMGRTLPMPSPSSASLNIDTW